MYKCFSSIHCAHHFGISTKAKNFRERVFLSKIIFSICKIDTKVVFWVFVIIIAYIENSMFFEIIQRKVARNKKCNTNWIS